MMVTVPLFLLLASLTGVCPRKPEEKYVRAGEMVALQCPPYRGDGRLIWTSHTSQEMNLTSDMSSAEQMEMGVLVHGRSLVILNASVNHQGNYSCSQGNASRKFWFKLMVYTTQTREYEEKTTYPVTCYTPESCTLTCPKVNPEHIPNITISDTIWHKKGESSPTASYFSSVKENDRGVYTCTRSYLYHGQIYNMTSTVKLEVQPQKKLKKLAEITSPRMSEVFPVDLGSSMVIDCQAVVYSEFAELFWLMDQSFVQRNNSLPVFYKFKPERDQFKQTASLVFKKVSKEDLLKNYTCKLECDSQPSSFVVVNLVQKHRPAYLSLALGIVCVVVVMVSTVVIYMKFKINITLFLRDTLGCHRTTFDGKSYDAFLMCYKSDTDAGLSDDDRKWLESVVEEQFSYSLCLFDRDVLPGKAVQEAVLDCVQQSRTVVLVPTSSDPGPGAGFLSVIHEALVERQTDLVFIRTEATEVRTSGSLSEALQLLSEAGDCVTWKGVSSKSLSSSFWKQLRYYLPAPQNASKIRLLPK